LKKRDDILEGMVSGKETQMLFCTNEIASTDLRYEITLRENTNNTVQQGEYDRYNQTSVRAFTEPRSKPWVKSSKGRV